MKNLFFLICVFFFVLSCAKKKIEKTEKKLVGSWELEKSVIGDKETDLTDRKTILNFYDNVNEFAVFDNTDLTYKHYGQMDISYGSYTLNVSFFYEAVEKGKELILSVESYNEFGTVYMPNQVSISKLNRNKFRMEGEDENGVKSVFTYKKIK